MKHIFSITILAIVAGLLNLASCQAFPVAQITEAANTVVPLKPISTTIVPSPTTTATPTLQVTPDLADTQRDQLYNASLKYLAENDEKAWQVAGSLEYAPLGGYPSNMCGPLAISILKDAGIISKSVSLHDFWLLNPDEDGKLLQNTFPADYFQWIHNPLAIDKIDFTEAPLLAGDLVYIYSGYQGDYSHVLAVTRVDAAGRAYSVTNNYTEDGFVIQEYLLYDPTEPGTGIFYFWTNPANRKLGLTGFGGMDIWRPIRLPYYADGKP